jgi:hypothetical protein
MDSNRWLTIFGNQTLEISFFLLVFNSFVPTCMLPIFLLHKLFQSRHFAFQVDFN